MSGYKANAYLVYGIKFEDDSVFPWSWDGDESVHWSERGNISSWWRKVNGYGLNDKYPCAPVDTVNYCNYDAPMYILTPSSIEYKECEQGDPVTIQPSDLIIPETARDELIAFCEKYGIKYDNRPQWWLVACYE